MNGFGNAILGVLKTEVYKAFGAWLGEKTRILFRRSGNRKKLLSHSTDRPSEIQKNQDHNIIAGDSGENRDEVMPNQTVMLHDIANKLNANPIDLDALISLESNWNPNAYNRSGAIGLIQFMPQTLKGMGLLSHDVDILVPHSGTVPENIKQKVRADFLSKYPTIQAQLYGPVLQYLKPYMPFPTRQSLYLSVFYPAYRNKDPNTEMPAIVQAQNPGVTTVGDYVALIDKRRKIKDIATTGGKIGLVALAALAGYIYYS